MRKEEMECNLELGLVPSSTSHTSTGSNGDQQMTIFYDGRICVCDVTDVQARYIISLASKKSREGMTCTSPKTNRERVEPISQTSIQSQKSYAQNGSLSMKRSLRQFLEKRKHRMQSISPYHRY